MTRVMSSSEGILSQSYSICKIIKHVEFDNSSGKIGVLIWIIYIYIYIHMLRDIYVTCARLFGTCFYEV